MFPEEVQLFLLVPLCKPDYRLWRTRRFGRSSRVQHCPRLLYFCVPSCISWIDRVVCSLGGEYLRVLRVGPELTSSPARLFVFTVSL
jgi:hypothetical protein